MSKENKKIRLQPNELRRMQRNLAIISFSALLLLMRLRALAYYFRVLSLVCYFCDSRNNIEIWKMLLFFSRLLLAIGVPTEKN